MVLGTNFADIRKRTTWRELVEAAWTLYFHYQGVTRTDIEDGDADPPADPASPS
jgi:hypothetical protein